MNGFGRIRVDDRLIHGQVMVGWALSLDIRKIYMVNDSSVADQWIGDAFRTAVSVFSPDMELEILTLEASPDRLSYDQSLNTTMVLVESISDALKLYELGVIYPELILGGVHYREGREKFIDYVYLDSDEIDAILQLSEKGVKVIARDLPGSKPVDIVELIGRKRGR